jgi:hypothetical protein
VDVQQPFGTADRHPPINLKLSYTHILSPFDLIQPSITFGVTRDATDAVVSLDYIHRF